MKDRTLYYDKQGKPISTDEWWALCNNIEYKVIKKTEIDDSLVSTVWLGIDQNFCFDEENNAPAIFETMVFKDDSYNDIDMKNYCTLEQAIEGHEEMVRRYRKE